MSYPARAVCRPVNIPGSSRSRCDQRRGTTAPAWSAPSLRRSGGAESHCVQKKRPPARATRSSGQTVSCRLRLHRATWRASRETSRCGWPRPARMSVRPRSTASMMASSWATQATIAAARKLRVRWSDQRGRPIGRSATEAGRSVSGCRSGSPCLPSQRDSTLARCATRQEVGSAMASPQKVPVVQQTFADGSSGPLCELVIGSARVR